MPSRKTRKISRRSSRRSGAIDVRSPASIGAFERMLKGGPLTLVLIYADWCGACHRFRDEVWSPLTELKNATVNRAAVREDMVNKTSLSNIERKFYPTLLLVGSDKKPASFPSDEGGTTNAMPRQPSLEEDKKVLTTLVNSPSVNKIAQSLGASGLPEQEESLKAPTLSIKPAAEVPRSITPGKSPFEDQTPPPMPGVATNYINGMPTPSVTPKEPAAMTNNLALPPDVGSDIVASQTRAKTGTQAVVSDDLVTQPAQRGGRMLRAIRRASASLRAMIHLRKGTMATRKHRQRRSSRKRRD